MVKKIKKRVEWYTYQLLVTNIIVTRCSHLQNNFNQSEYQAECTKKYTNSVGKSNVSFSFLFSYRTCKYLGHEIRPKVRLRIRANLYKTVHIFDSGWYLSYTQSHLLLKLVSNFFSV